MLTVKVGTAGTYPLGAVPETNLKEGMKLFLYMLVIDDGDVKLGNADFFNMKIAEDSTSGAFFTDDEGNVITEVQADLHVNIWAPLSADVEYTPVVALAEDDNGGNLGSSSGGCNAVNVFAPVLLLSSLIFLKRK